MGRISVLLPDELLARARKKFGKDMTPAISRIVERGLSDATEDSVELDEPLMRSLSSALDGKSFPVDDAYWEARIARPRRPWLAKTQQDPPRKLSMQHFIRAT